MNLKGLFQEINTVKLLLVIVGVLILVCFLFLSYNSFHPQPKFLFRTPPRGFLGKIADAIYSIISKIFHQYESLFINILSVLVGVLILYSFYLIINYTGIDLGRSRLPNIKKTIDDSITDSTKKMTDKVKEVIEGSLEKPFADMKETASKLFQDTKKALVEKVVKIEQDVDIVKQDVDIIKQDVDIIKQDVTSMKKTVNAVKEDMNSVKTDIQNLNKMKETVDAVKKDMDSVKNEIENFNKNTLPVISSLMTHLNLGEVTPKGVFKLKEIDVPGTIKEPTGTIPPITPFSIIPSETIKPVIPETKPDNNSTESTRPNNEEGISGNNKVVLEINKSDISIIPNTIIPANTNTGISKTNSGSNSEITGSNTDSIKKDVPELNKPNEDTPEIKNHNTDIPSEVKDSSSKK